MAPFDQYTLTKARAAIPADGDYTYVDETVDGTLIQTGYTANKRLYDGDAWLDGAGWIGPRPSATETDYQSVLTEIRRAFISKNAVREVVDRHIGGVVGQEPSWKLTPRRALA